MTVKAPPLWRVVLKNNFTQLKELCDFLELSLEHRRMLKVPPHFILNLPLRIAQKISKKNLDDPLLKQFVPFKNEMDFEEGYTSDPNLEADFTSQKSYIQKYEARALLITTSACAMHCRYCFRKEFPYQSNPSFEKEIEKIEANPSLHEVILSGGDPLSLSDSTLFSLLTKLDRIPHITKIRFHSRFIIGIPERVDDAFIELLKQIKTSLYFVLHINHPKELDSEVLEAAHKLRKAGITLLNQSVLLKGVNDCPKVQLELNRLLIDHQILPYYLHQLDRVSGTQHFEVSKERGRKLIQFLQSKLPGYGVPKFVEEVPGLKSKKPL